MIVKSLEFSKKIANKNIMKSLEISNTVDLIYLMFFDSLIELSKLFEIKHFYNNNFNRILKSIATDIENKEVKGSSQIDFLQVLKEYGIELKSNELIKSIRMANVLEESTVSEINSLICNTIDCKIQYVEKKINMLKNESEKHQNLYKSINIYKSIANRSYNMTNSLEATSNGKTINFDKLTKSTDGYVDNSFLVNNSISYKSNDITNLNNKENILLEFYNSIMENKKIDISDSKEKSDNAHENNLDFLYHKDISIDTVNISNEHKLNFNKELYSNRYFLREICNNVFGNGIITNNKDIHEIKNLFKLALNNFSGKKILESILNNSPENTMHNSTSITNSEFLLEKNKYKLDSIRNYIIFSLSEHIKYNFKTKNRENFKKNFYDSLILQGKHFEKFVEEREFRSNFKNYIDEYDYGETSINKLSNSEEKNYRNILIYDRTFFSHRYKNIKHLIKFKNYNSQGFLYDFMNITQYNDLHNTLQYIIHKKSKDIYFNYMKNIYLNDRAFLDSSYLPIPLIDKGETNFNNYKGYSRVYSDTHNSFSFAIERFNLFNKASTNILKKNISLSESIYKGRFGKNNLISNDYSYIVLNSNYKRHFIEIIRALEVIQGKEIILASRASVIKKLMNQRGLDSTEKIKNISYNNLVGLIKDVNNYINKNYSWLDEKYMNFTFKNNNFLHKIDRYSNHKIDYNTSKNMDLKFINGENIIYETDFREVSFNKEIFRTLYFIENSIKKIVKENSKSSLVRIIERNNTHRFTEKELEVEGINYISYRSKKYLKASSKNISFSKIKLGNRLGKNSLYFTSILNSSIGNTSRDIMISNLNVKLNNNNYFENYVDRNSSFINQYIEKSSGESSINIFNESYPESNDNSTIVYKSEKTNKDVLENLTKAKEEIIEIEEKTIRENNNDTEKSKIKEKKVEFIEPLSEINTASNTINVEEIVEKTYHKLLRKIEIENKRRGIR